MNTSRRNFLKTSALVTGYGILSAPVARAAAADAIGVPTVQPLETGWEFNRTTFGNPWEMWSLHATGWSPVQLPHCFNHHDCCDPNTPAYRGQGWYRTKINPINPYPGGRTLLHFGGAGQRTSVYAGNTLMGHNTGGYNEFVVDLTSAERDAKGEIPSFATTPATFTPFRPMSATSTSTAESTATSGSSTYLLSPLICCMSKPQSSTAGQHNVP